MIENEEKSSFRSFPVPLFTFLIKSMINCFQCLNYWILMILNLSCIVSFVSVLGVSEKYCYIRLVINEYWPMDWQGMLPDCCTFELTGNWNGAIEVDWLRFWKCLWIRWCDLLKWIGLPLALDLPCCMQELPLNVINSTVQWCLYGNLLWACSLPAQWMWECLWHFIPNWAFPLYTLGTFIFQRIVLPHLFDHHCCVSILLISLWWILLGYQIKQSEVL